MKALCVIYFGQILTKEQDGGFLHEEQVILSDKISLSSSTERMT